MALIPMEVEDPIVHTGSYDKNSASSLSNATESLFTDLPDGKAFNVIMRYNSTQYYCCGMKINNSFGNVLSFAFSGAYPLRYSTRESGTWTHKIVSLQNL